MKISAQVRNRLTAHEVELSTDGTRHSLAIAPRSTGPGSSVNGGEFLMLALATCYCNDVYREAARLGIPIEAVEVEASGDFDGVGLAATNIRYRATVSSSAPDHVILELLTHTDAVAEIHNTLRLGATVERIT